MAKAFFIRTLHGLAPDGDTALESLRGVKIGQTVAVEVTRPRNIQMHKLYWLICSTIANSVGAEAENISDVLKVRTGHCVTVMTKGGRLQFPRSISFAKMDDAAFRNFFDRCCNIIASEWLGGISDAEAKAQIEEMIGVTYHAANPRSIKAKVA